MYNRTSYTNIELRHSLYTIDVELFYSSSLQFR